jgi:hypothetical protein
MVRSVRVFLHRTCAVKKVFIRLDQCQCIRSEWFEKFENILVT